MTKAKPHALYKPFPGFQEWSRTPVELGFWHETVGALEIERKAASPSALEQAASIVTRAAAVDTSAIEGFYDVDRGFTLSVATHAANWQAAFAKKGEAARSMFDAQLRAAELVIDAATRNLPVNEAFVRALHEHICASQNTYRVLTAAGWQDQALVKGAYKQHPNNPRLQDGHEHAYAPVVDVPTEMGRLVTELQSKLFARSPAPIQAAYAHYSFVAIHPFADGNGRVARALASIYLVRATSVPLLVFADQKPRYLDALASADNGNYVAFSEFVRDRSVDAVNLFVNTIQRASLSPLDDLRRDATRLHFSAPNLTHGQVDALADRLLHEAMSQTQAIFENLELPKQLSVVTAIKKGDSRGPLPGYRRLGRPELPRLEVVVRSERPAAAEVGAVVRPLVARDEHPQPIRLEEQNRSLFFDVRLEDLNPEMTAVVYLRLQVWLEALLLRMVEEAIQRGRQSLEKSGWNG